MINARFIEQITAAVRSAIPADLGQQAEKNLRAALEGLFSRADLVTREEFEVQQGVLSRTREKLERLEKKVAELEAKGEHNYRSGTKP